MGSGPQQIPGRGVQEGMEAVAALEQRRRRRVSFAKQVVDEQQQDASKEDTVGEIDEDLISFIRGQVDNLTNETVQALFAKIVAGEISELIKSSWTRQDVQGEKRGIGGKCKALERGQAKA